MKRIHFRRRSFDQINQLSSLELQLSMSEPISHDQNFKNLILDYPRQALQFFAPEEAIAIDDSVKITPIRQEQHKNRLGDRFQELDVPLKVEWPDGRRAALLFLFEEETDPGRFSIYRLGRYCLDLAELMETDRIVPIVIFLKGSARIRDQVRLGSEHRTFLTFEYLSCVLNELPAEDYKDSVNIVARITLPTMAYACERLVDVFAAAVRGLELELNTEKRFKYMDFIDTYSKLDDNDLKLFAELYPREDQTMTTWSQRMLAQGRQEGRQEGEAAVLLRLLVRRFGTLGAVTTERVRQASPTELERWADNILEARTIDEVFGLH